MSLSAKDALEAARPNIKAAQEARGTKNTVRCYQAAKTALAKVDIEKTDAPSLKEMIIALQDLAVILDNSGLRLHGKAAKCRKRADSLRRKLEKKVNFSTAAVVQSLVGPGFSEAITQARVMHMAPSASASSRSRSAISTATSSSTATFIAASTTPAVRATPATRQLVPLHSQTASAVPAAIMQASPSFFCKNVNAASYLCHLPRPDEPLQATRQLAYCIALLQSSIDEDDYSPDALQWRQKTLGNSAEQGRLENMAAQILQTFALDPMKDAATVAEIVRLAPILSMDHCRFLLKTFIDTVDQSNILQYHSMKGLVKVIQGAAPGSIDSNDLVSILRCLHNRLRLTHSEGHRYSLLLVISQVLDAMADAHIGDIDRINLHGPLTDFLRKLSGEDPYLDFQVAYATQALLNLSDDENIWRAGFRRGWLVLKGGAGFAKMPDPREVKDALGGLETLWELGEEGVRLLKDTLEAIKTQESPTFTVKEGLKFRRAWYRTLRSAESYILTGKLIQFKELVTTTPCRNQLMFQWGICQLLGRFATDTQWDADARGDAVAFVGVLYRGETIWRRHENVDQVISDVLTDLVATNGPHFEAAKTMLEEVRKQNAGQNSFSHLHSRLLNNTLSENPSEFTTRNTLLKAVQDRNHRRAKIENLPDQAAQPGLADIQSALKLHYAPDLVILRVSGDTLDIETCFVNLAIVEAPAQREKEKQDLKEKAAVFHRISSFEKVEGANIQSSIPLEQIFNKRRLREGREDIPKRILVQGRAGIGKTTLCKKLVHAHQTGLWKDRFDTVLWLPLRQLKAFRVHTLEELFRKKFFTHGLDQEVVALAQALAVSAQNGRVLFILDGLDEIMSDTACDETIALRLFLKTLLLQKYVVITSRPSGLDRSLLPTLDLELETIGFSQKNVSDFLSKVLGPEEARTVQDFIQQTPLLQGLVNIPVQLDVICFSWKSLPTDGQALTMTRLYQLMVRRLWWKDAYLLEKEHGNKKLTKAHIRKLKPEIINELMATELQHLGYLAFKGMNSNHQIEFDEEDLLNAFEDLDKYSTDKNRLLPPQLLEVMKQTSFLHTADADLEPGHSDAQQKWHFLHLTSQEYFAATWIAGHLQAKQSHPSVRMMTMAQASAFVLEHKCNPQYEILWWMVAGLLEKEALINFFSLLQGAPRDLIGGRHQQILASCLNEARVRLDPEDVAAKESELRQWLHFELQACPHDDEYKSVLGSQFSFPEHILVETMPSVNSWKMKAAAARTLGARSTLSDSAIQSLTVTLKDENGHVRHAAATALGSQSTLTESVLQTLIAALWDESEAVGYSAAWALRSQSTLSESAIRSLIAALRGENQDVRYLATSILSKQSTLSESSIHSLIAALQEEYDDVKQSATSILGNQSELLQSAIPSLIDALNDESVAVRCSAAWALRSQSTLSESTIQSVIALLWHEDEGVRYSVSSALSNQSKLPELVVLSLVAALNDQDEDVRSSVASILGKQSTLPNSAILTLIAGLWEDALFRDSAALILSKQSTLPESVAPSLIAALSDQDKHVRNSAASVLSNQSALSESTIESLTAALWDDHEDVRRSAATVLGSQSTLPESAIQSLIAALWDEHEGVKHSAAMALGNQSMLPKSVIEPLIAALKDNDVLNAYSEAAAQALASKDDDMVTLPDLVIHSLVALLKDKNEDVRLSAALALGGQSPLRKLVVLSVTALLQDDDVHVIFAAAFAPDNKYTLPDTAMQTLITALKDEHEDIRLSAASALRQQSTLSESAILSLIALLNDKVEDVDYDVRSSASMALGNHGRSLYTLLPRLQEDEISCLYRHHLLRYSCEHVLSLQLQNNRLCFYTNQGPALSEPISFDEKEVIISAFKSVQQEARFGFELSSNKHP